MRIVGFLTFKRFSFLLELYHSRMFLRLYFATVMVLTYVFFRVVLTSCNFMSLPSFDRRISPSRYVWSSPLAFRFQSFLCFEAGNGSKVTTNRKSVRLPETNDVFVPCRVLNPMCAISLTDDVLSFYISLFTR